MRICRRVRGGGVGLLVGRTCARGTVREGRRTRRQAALPWRVPARLGVELSGWMVTAGGGHLPDPRICRAIVGPTPQSQADRAPPPLRATALRFPGCRVRPGLWRLWLLPGIFGWLRRRPVLSVRTINRAPSVPRTARNDARVDSPADDRADDLRGEPSCALPMFTAEISEYDRVARLSGWTQISRRPCTYLTTASVALRLAGPGPLLDPCIADSASVRHVRPDPESFLLVLTQPREQRLRGLFARCRAGLTQGASFDRSRE